MGNSIISIRIVSPVSSGKTHVAETIRKALIEEYGGEVDISLTDIAHDTNSLDELLAPASGVSFKIIEDHSRR